MGQVFFFFPQGPLRGLLKNIRVGAMCIIMLKNVKCQWARELGPHTLVVNNAIKDTCSGPLQDLRSVSFHMIFMARPSIRMIPFSLFHH